MRSKTTLRSQKHDIQMLMKFAVAGVKAGAKRERALPSLVREAIAMFDGRLLLDDQPRGLTIFYEQDEGRPKVVQKYLSPPLPEVGQK
jgi:hypothetical protein